MATQNHLSRAMTRVHFHPSCNGISRKQTITNYAGVVIAIADHAWSPPMNHERFITHF